MFIRSSFAIMNQPLILLILFMATPNLIQQTLAGNKNRDQLNFVLTDGSEFLQIDDHTQVSIFPEKGMDSFYRLAAEEMIQAVQKNPQAVILLPTGSTPEKMYREIVRRFAVDEKIDFSEAHFFNLDEYVGLPPEHPLSYHYYMEHFFYGPLDKISQLRSPKKTHRHLPATHTGQNLQTPDQMVAEYENQLNRAIASNPSASIDLAILGVGGAYPHLASNGTRTLRGGHIAFNEPGATAQSPTHVANLTDKTKLDTKYRFSSLGYLLAEGTLSEFNDKNLRRPFSLQVPDQAITLGMDRILSAKRIVVLANGESKAPVIHAAFNRQHEPGFPASLLRNHPETHWILDEFAALSLKNRPWDHLQKGQIPQIPQAIWTTWIKKAAVEFFTHSSNLAPQSSSINNTFREPPYLKDLFPNLVLDSSKGSTDEGTSSSLVSELSLDQLIKTSVRELQEELVKSASPDQLPQGKRILVISPHPDDDVISMGATLVKLRERGNEIKVLYAVSGSNSVRETDPSYQKAYSAALASMNESNGPARPHFSPAAENSFTASWLAKAQVRQQEATLATTHLGIPASRLIFLDAQYYQRRGIPGINPIPDSDIQKMKKVLEEFRPQHIYFAAENDPHGAHGLSTQLVALALPKNMPCSFHGYRGAYNEWSMTEPETLTVVLFDASLMNRKIESIKMHTSQLNPLFPSFDPREFFERAKDRNRSSAKQFFQITGLPAQTFQAQKNAPSEFNNRFAEVFKNLSSEEFLEHVLGIEAKDKSELPLE